MPRKGAVDAPRFSGSPDDLLRYLKDVRVCCMQASCFEDCGWAQWAIWYLGTDKFEQWRRCPPAQYLKYDLYDLVDKQKKVKINSSEAILDYQLCFTEVATHLQVTNQLSSIEKDDLYLEGFDREFQGEILQSLEWDGQRRHTEDPWPTCQVTQEAKRLFKKGYCSDLRQVHMAREQSKAECQRMAREIPPIKPQDAQDEPRTDEWPVEAVAHALEVPKPTLEPRGDLCEVPEQAGHTEVEEIRLEVEVKRQSKVVAWRKPPEVKTRRKTLKSVTRRIKEILPGFWITHCSVCPTSLRAVYLKGMKYMEESDFQHSKTDQEGCLKYQDTKDTLYYEADTSLHRRKDSKDLTYGSSTLGYMECYINLKYTKVFEGSNQLKTPSKLSFRFQGAVVPSTSSTELKGSSLLQQSALGLF
ncbi:hypothetical protein EV401DRAFT_1892461 [Pisolithus croceorrhizus]|nr:hypothetical protein EV401DRAFT_1892461 [Pisolithus croceorrhizus]